MATASEQEQTKVTPDQPGNSHTGPKTKDDKLPPRCKIKHRKTRQFQDIFWELFELSTKKSTADRNRHLKKVVILR
ncbi:MAG: hypothetical protein HOG03_07940 [Desulfobacula sp.]|uniref:hypothetical protein n=1 Tax=Desulfobacula sp. TaxID=2593537 RepID=UPI001D94D0FD|nr:hypothetical protein [Desulfobacula sp.]MBT4025823.1 hypothetical protein [Desulfobacula sp.]MBT4199237.1 hypothetical protein [Desulfobacula sp.]MBT4506477.1 hypothetical protein [Desulfobacula sp.]MBT4877623.1 hypothetical protein [Desulfobacula sp.]